MTDPRTHFRFGWWTLALFALGGLVLEALHGFKVGLYLDPGGETRRLLWTLAHAHGTLFGLLHLGWGATVASVADLDGKQVLRVSRLLRGATVLLPGGFALGGIWTYGSDPGPLAAVLTPVGGVMMVAAMIFAARALSRTDG